jgi:methanogen homocitrate synthase
MVSIFIATSDLHIRHKYRKPREQVLEDALAMIDLVKDQGIAIRFAAEDASRTDPAFLKHVYVSAGDRGANLVSFADTVGCLTPLDMYRVMNDLVASVKRPLCAHCHNDMGFASANTITAAEAGAFQLHTTVNGIGERAGNAALEEVLIALRMKGGVDRYDLSHLQRDLPDGRALFRYHARENETGCGRTCICTRKRNPYRSDSRRSPHV